MVPGSVRLWVRLDAVEAHQRSLAAEREVVEQLFIYNADEPREKHVVTLVIDNVNQ